MFKSAMSLDGHRDQTGDSKWISGEESRGRAPLAAELDAVCVGIGTALRMTRC